ncbi:MAG: HAD-IA family hydrolase [Candidatus Aquicultor sp.]
MQELKAALFDIDGTLLDTSEFIFQAYEYTLNKFGLAPRTRSEVSVLIGKSLETCYELLAPGVDIAGIHELAKTHRYFQGKHLDLSKPYPGTAATLEALKIAGIKIAAVTTRQRSSSVKTMALAGISEFIDFVVALEDVTHLKPDPEPVLKALAYLNVQPVDAIMTGDSDVDIFAGKNAGTATVGVTYGFHGARIADCNPDYIIDSIEEIVPVVLPEVPECPVSRT